MSVRIMKKNSFRAIYLAKRRRGFSMLEMVLVLGIAAMLSVMIVTWMQNSAERMRAKGVADKMMVVTEAAKQYIKANASALQTRAPTSGALVIPVGRETISSSIPNGPSGLDSIQGGGFLPPSFVDTNSYGQRTALLVKRSTVGTGGIQAILTTYGGRKMSDEMLGHAANVMGAVGGYVPENPVVDDDDGMVVGNYGGWRTPTNQWGATTTRPAEGHLQSTLAFDSNALLADYLYRHDIGIPEANQMSTNLDMTNNNVNNVNTLRGHEDQDIKVGSDIDLLDNDLDNVNTIRAQGNTVVVDDNLQAIDIYARNMELTGNSLVRGNSTVQQNLTVGGVADVHDLRADLIDANAVVYEGNPANTKNLRLADLLPKSVAQYSYLVTPSSPNVPKPTCANDDRSKARVMVYSLTDSWRAIPDVQLDVKMATTLSGESFVGNVGVKSATVDIASAITATTASTNALTWRINWIGTPTSAAGERRAIAQTFCYYGD